MRAGEKLACVYFVLVSENSDPAELEFDIFDHNWVLGIVVEEEKV